MKLTTYTPEFRAEADVMQILPPDVLTGRPVPAGAPSFPARLYLCCLALL